MIRRSWRTFLAGVAMAGGLSVSGSAFADEECCPTVGDLDCQGCQQLFADNNQQLTDELAKMSCCNESSCCAPTSVCESVDPCCAEGCCAAEDNGITLGGWVQMGYHNGVTPNAAAPFDAGSFNNHPNRVNLHQGWLYAEKVADGSNGLDFGFRADVMYGVDAADTQSFGAVLISELTSRTVSTALQFLSCTVKSPVVTGVSRLDTSTHWLVTKS